MQVLRNVLHLFAGCDQQMSETAAEVIMTGEIQRSADLAVNRKGE